MKNNLLFGLMFLFALTGMALATSGSFGEIAGPLTYNAFITSSQTRVWTIVNNYNFSLQFYVTKPNLTDASITTSVSGGIINADSYYPINVTIVSHTTDTQSAYISAYAASNSTGSTGVGSSIRLGVVKLIEINGTDVVANNQVPPLNSSANNSVQNSGTTSITGGGQNIQGAATTVGTGIVQSTNASAQGSSAASATSVSTYLIVGVIAVLVIICALGYFITKKYNFVKKS